MVKSAISVLFSILHDATSYLPPGLFLALPTAFIEGGKHVSTFRAEFVGTLLMIACTFSAGKWIGKDSLEVAWTSHFFGVIAADYFGGGPHVNPAVTMSMLALGKSSYTDAYVRVAAQMGGGLIAFPIYHALAINLEWEPLGGPEFSMDDHSAEIEAFLSESLATFCLCLLIYAVNWEWNFGKYHYIIKQSLTAIGIRGLIEFFPTAGPAMNPMLATSWDVFAVGNTFEFPSDMNHYFVYWVGPFLAAILASIVYVIYAGGTIFGAKLPIGPLKKTKRD
mmetsp:Transcript_10244/g.14372  ORF Transcript_10244/g.14372 Transcript_10244/m.14372 type:complete len:279 (+) Transcript_10244:107-943(+)